MAGVVPGRGKRAWVEVMMGLCLRRLPFLLFAGISARYEGGKG